jgi:hypothetical protein
MKGCHGDIIVREIVRRVSSGISKKFTCAF